MSDAYTRIFERCGLTFRAGRGGHRRDRRQPVARVPGARRLGRGRHRELRPLRLRRQRREGGDRRAPPPAPARRRRARARCATPGQAHGRGGRRVPRRAAGALHQDAALSSPSDGDVVAALVRGDHELSRDEAAGTRSAAPAVALADAATVRAAHRRAGRLRRARSGCDVRILADHALRGMRGAVTGANATDQHLVGVDQARDLPERRRSPTCARRAPGDPLPALRRTASFDGPPRHRGRPGLLPRHQVQRGDEGDVPRRRRPGAAASRWAATASASRARSRPRSSRTTTTTASSGRCRSRRSHVARRSPVNVDRRARCARRPSGSYAELEARGRRGAARRSRRAPGRQVQGRRPDRHARSASPSAPSALARGCVELKPRAPRRRRSEVPLAEVVARVAALVRAEPAA